LSSAAIDALGEDVADDESSMGFFDRISKSIGVKGTEQRIRRTKEKIDSVSKALNDTKVELEDAIESERIASTAYAAVNHLLENKSSEVDNIRSQFTAATNAYTAAKKEESDTKSALRKRDEEVNASLKKSLTISQNMGNTEIEISQLEEALAKKRKQLEELVADQALCTSYLEANVSSTEALRASYSTAVTSKAEREAVYNDVDAKLRVVQQQLEAATRENTAAEDAFRRQRDYLGLVTRRAEDLKKKSADLEERLEEDLKGWVETKTLIETERKRTAELKRKQEEEAVVAAEMANLDMLRQRIDRRNKDLLQIEEDKRRLELEAIEEMEALKRTEENLKARKRIGGQ
jgi:chromosome segregation ATPase